MKLQIIEAAQDDLIQGFDFYETRETGIGDYFLSCLYSDIESLKIYGGIHGVISKDLHRALSRRFPFAIYYAVINNIVVIRAVLDCWRNPSWIRRRLKDAE